MITVTGLDFAYETGDPILRGIDLSVRDGEVLALAGTNGSGKSTLLAVLAGLYRPDRGTATAGEDDLRAVARLVMQNPDIQILGGTLEEDLLLGRDEAVRPQAEAVAARLGLTKAMDKPVQTLSYGMKRKLCLATALLDEPRVLLLDEPFSGLDYPAARQMRAFISERKAAGATLVIAVHGLEPVVDLVDRLAVLDSGRLALLGTPEEVLDRVPDHGVRQPCSWQHDREIRAWDREEDDRTSATD